MRTGEGDEAINVLFDYGYTGGHAHPDKMNIVLYANGRLQAPDGILAYNTPECFTYNGMPVGHNTVVVDESAHHPSEEQTLTFLGITPKVQIADAVDSEADTHVHLRQTLMLTGSYLVDFFNVSSDRPHRYDWVYHNLGTISTELPLQPHRDALGVANGYIPHRRRLQIQNRCARGTPDETPLEGSVLIQMAGGEATEVIIGAGPGCDTSNPEETIPVLLARRFSEKTVYASIISPYRIKPGISRVTGIAASQNGTGVNPTEATSLEITKESGKGYFLTPTGRTNIPLAKSSLMARCWRYLSNTTKRHCICMLSTQKPLEWGTLPCRQTRKRRSI